MIKDYTGQRFGRLLIIKRIRDMEKKITFYETLCACGKKIITTHSRLKSKNTQSCGCFKKEKTIERSITHGLRKSPLYRIWTGIKNRCLNKNYQYYKDYGGRGIKVCERWMKFKNFYEDMFPAYQKGLSIDRIDNDGNYSPENCRWSTNKEQSNNRRSNLYIEFEGKRMTLIQWAVHLNIPHSALDNRINKYGWSVEKALITPIRSFIWKRKGCK